MSDKVYVGSRCSSLEVGEPYPPVSRVTFHRDDEVSYTAGDDTGYHMEYDMPWATQEMVNDVYQKIKGFVYKPFKAYDAMIDPAAEPGDMVTVGGEYFMLAQMDTVFDAKCASTIGAPGKGDIEHEYPYIDPVEREMKRRVKLGQSYQGVKIDRLNGLTIQRIQEADGAKQVLATAMLNAQKFAFYKGSSTKDEDAQLYFDAAEGCYKFKGSLNVNNNFVVDKDGNVTLNGSIKWGIGNAPNKKRYAASKSAPPEQWHETMQSGDIYCCDWNYTTEKWGEPYKFVGTDGAPATLPGYIKQTYIDASKVASFHIMANKLEAVCPAGSSSDTETGFILTGGFEDQALRYLRIYSYPGLPPTTVFTSPNRCSAVLDFSGIELRAGVLDLRNILSIDWGNNAPTFVLA